MCAQVLSSAAVQAQADSSNCSYSQWSFEEFSEKLKVRLAFHFCFFMSVEFFFFFPVSFCKIAVELKHVRSEILGKSKRLKEDVTMWRVLHAACKLLP